MPTRRPVTTLPGLPSSCWEAATTGPRCDPSRRGASRPEGRAAEGDHPFCRPRSDRKPGTPRRGRRPCPEAVRCVVGFALSRHGRFGGGLPEGDATGIPPRHDVALRHLPLPHRRRGVPLVSPGSVGRTRGWDQRIGRHDRRPGRQGRGLGRSAPQPFPAVARPHEARRMPPEPHASVPGPRRRGRPPSPARPGLRPGLRLPRAAQSP